MQQSRGHDLDLDRLLADLAAAVEDATRLLFGLRLAPRSTRQKLNSLILVHGILRKARGVLQLSEGGNFDCIAPLVRSALIHFVDQRNNLNYDDYGDLLDYIRTDHWMKNLRAHRENPESPYSKSLIKHRGTGVTESLYTMISTQRRELTAAKAKLAPRYLNKGGSVKSGEYNKFELAGMLDSYHALFRGLSKDVHGNLDTLADPLIGDGGLVWPPSNPTPSLVQFHVMLDIVLDAAVALARRYRKPAGRCRAIRSRYERGMVSRGAA